MEKAEVFFALFIANKKLLNQLKKRKKNEECY